MASVTKKTAEVTYVLEMSKHEAAVFTELLLSANHLAGEGEVIADMYDALCRQGAESDEFVHEVDDTEMVISKADE